MILDSSAVVAIVCYEPGFEELVDRIVSAESVAIAAPVVFEAAVVLTTKLRRDGLAQVNDFLRESGVKVLPFSEEHASFAFSAFLRYGKGRHPAALNFGDCLSYAAAKVSGQPLLFVGRDFAKTDIVPA